MDIFGHCTITATIRSFSSCAVEGSVSREYDCDNDRFNYYFSVSFYANGSCVDNGGHVSIIFNENDANFNLLSKPVAFSCVASVIDASGNNRFPQSLALDLDSDFIYPNDKLFFTKGFGFDKFVKRSTLLNDPSELLPNDCLTLCLEIDYKVTRNFKLTHWSYDRHAFHRENRRWYLCMDTGFGRELCKMSTVFQDMIEFTIVESGPIRIPIPEEEYESFSLIFDYLTQYKLEAIISDICDLYIVADKYDLQQIVQLCHQLLITVMSEMNTLEKLECVDKDIHLISELAERFEDDKRLREILTIYSDIQKKLEDCSGELDASNACKLETGWNCEYRIGQDFSVFFVFRKNKSERLKADIHK